MAAENVKYSVLPNKYASGPHGLGDPEDKTLRRVEVDVLIPKKMREKANKEKCTKEVEAFGECCKKNKFLMVVTCRDENRALWSCLEHWYHNEDFRNQCTKEYLDERSEYRRTGIGSKYQKKPRRLESSM